MTKRQAIDKFRNDLRERNADTEYTNQFLYQSLLVHARWLIKREVSAGRIYRNNSFFQTMYGREIIEVPTVPVCLGIRTNCKMYRTKTKLPEMWLDNNGPVIKAITSVDGSTSFTIISANQWLNKKEDPYQKFSKEKYVIFAEDHLWFPQHNPHNVNINAFFTDDITREKEFCSNCDENNEDCITFLDTKFMVPDWVEGELFAKALEQVAGITKRLPEDQQIDKNTTRKN